MIVDRVSEHLGDVFDQSIPSVANLAYFYQSSPPDSEPSSPPGGQSAPTSPQSDSEWHSGPTDTAYTTSLNIADQLHFGKGGTGKQAFKGVRVRNPVKTLLEHIRSSRKFPSSNVESYGTQICSTEDSYSEIINLLVGTKRLAPENLTDSPPYKQSPTFNSSYPLTPPQTPNSLESSDEIHKTESAADVNPDVLQDIIKMLQNDTQQISLNTVQVSWAKKEHLFQGEGELVVENYMQELPPIQMHPQPQGFPDFQLPSSSQVPGPPQSFQQCQGFQQMFGGNGQHQRFQQIPCDPQPQGFHHFATDCHLRGFRDAPDPAVSQVFQNRPVDEQVVGGEPQPEGYPLASFDSLPTAVYYATQNHPAQSQSTSPVNHAQGKSFFQWQLEQEEKKLSHLTAEQLLAKDSDGDTLLHIAVAQGRRALSYVLGKKMFAVNMMDVKERNGQSALQVAIAANQHLIVEDLVSLGAQVNTADRWGRTPLHVIAEKGHFQVLVAIEKGLTLSGQRLNLEVTNFDGMTALHLAILTHNSTVRELHNKIQLQCRSVEELLMKKKSLLDTIKTFVQMGASIETRERKTGRAALHLAAEEANVELLRFFLEQPTSLSSVNAKAYSSNTALHIVAGLQSRASQVDAVRLLMRKGADPSARNLENEQPVHLVPDGPRGEEVKRILKGRAVQSRISPF